MLEAAKSSGNGVLKRTKGDQLGGDSAKSSQPLRDGMGCFFVPRVSLGPTIRPWRHSYDGMAVVVRLNGYGKIGTYRLAPRSAPMSGSAGKTLQCFGLTGTGRIIRRVGWNILRAGEAYILPN